MMKKILLADDDREIVLMLTRLLKRDGYDVTPAYDGEEAVACYKSGEFDLIISDIVMPNSGGLKAMREIRKVDPDIKIIAMSGGAQIDEKTYLRMAKQVGASATFEKPLDLDAFRKKINELIA